MASVLQEVRAAWLSSLNTTPNTSPNYLLGLLKHKPNRLQCDGPGVLVIVVVKTENKMVPGLVSF